MQGWLISFELKEANNVIEFHLKGNDAAIRMGLQMVYLTAGAKLKERITNGIVAPDLFKDGMELYGIQKGAALKAYEGTYLTIKPVRKVSGLESSVNVEWSD